MNTIINEAEVQIEGYPVLWRTGREIIDVFVALGQNDRSSNCKIVLADPTGQIAADLIRHTEKQGGIQKLPSPKQNMPTGDMGAMGANTGDNVTFTKMSPQRMAMLDTIAWAEGARYNTTFGGGTFKNFADHPDLTGELQYGGRSNASGRYQFMARSPATWEGCKRALGLTDFSPASQDKAAIYLIQGRGALADVDSGNISAALDKLSYEWASLPPQRYPNQSVKTKAEVIATYNAALSRYQSGGGATQATKDTVAQPSTTPGTSPGNTSEDIESTFKGAKITVSCADSTFTFFHQGTKTGFDGKTTLIGQGIRWHLSRRKRSKTESNLSLKELAGKIAAAQRLTLDWQADIDPKYEHVAQVGISDYALLKRECERSGLFVSEDGTKLVIKSLRNIRDTAIVLRPGLNLITWEVSDEALDDSKEDAGSSLGQSEAKTEIEPLSGQLKQTKQDIDTTKDKSVTGKPQKAPVGKMEPGQEAIAQQNNMRVKRVKGLPSTFVIPLTKESLSIAPLDAVRTQGLPDTLCRVWLVDVVQHNYASATTQLQVYSPVEILVEDTGLQMGEAGAVSSGGYIYPVTGYPVTDIMRWRAEVGRPHLGTDIGCPEGTPIKAMADGQVTRADGEDAGGYGNVIYIKHKDGRETRYAHLSVMLVKPGQPVRQGQIIAKSGATGRGSGAHLHLEIRNPQGQAVNLSTVGFPEPKNGDIWR